MTDFANARPGCNSAQQLRIAFRPFDLARFAFDQVLPDFDQRMRKPARRAVPVEAVVLEAACVGFVVADDEAGLGAQARNQRCGETIVAVPENAAMPGPRAAAPGGRETVNRNDDRHDARRQRAVERRGDGRVIGRMKHRDATPEFFGATARIDIAIGRHDRAVRQFHHDGRIVFPAIEIDEKPRKARQHRRGAKRPRQRPGNTGRADVVCNVTREFRIGQAERAITRRQRVGRVVADHQKGRVAPGRDKLTGTKRGGIRPGGWWKIIHRRTIPEAGRGENGPAMTRAHDETRARLRRFYDTAVAAALPIHCLPPHLPDPPEAGEGRLVIFAIGKAAAAMAAVAEDHYDRHWPGTHIEGMALTRYGHARPTRHVEVVEAAHPVPDVAGAAASIRLMRMAEWLGPHDLALVLLSGGGSALTALPIPGIKLADEKKLTRALLASGLPIADINCLRKHISRIKGGRLAEAMHPARSVTLAISDVAGDDPSTIASGPTVPDTTSKERALAILDGLGADLDPHIRAAIEAAPETPKPGAEFFLHATYKRVASGSESLIAAAKLARSEGYETLVLGDDIEGEARLLAREHAGLVRMAQGEGRRLAIISGGEAGVTFGEGAVRGKGGPNQEYALALMLALKGTPGVAALAGDTDGIDGGSGADDDPAGAFVLPDAIRRAEAAGLDLLTALERHDSGTCFAALGDLLVTGPSYTNVNDFRVILVDNAPPEEESPS